MAIGREFGRELLGDPDLGTLERLYVRLLGVPVLGMRVRAGYLVPLLEGLRDRPPARVLDAGAGRGLFTALCARLFPDASVVGYDLDAEQLEKNRAMMERAGLANCRFETRDLTHLELEREIDLLLSVDNLEHIEDDRSQLRRFHRALRPGGLLLIHVPHRTRNLFGWRRENFMEIEGHVRPGYTRPELLGLLREAGFEIERSGYSYNSVETLANDLSFLVTGGRERRRALYAAAFPLLLALAQLGAGWAPAEGSGLWVLARRPARDGEEAHR